MKYKLLVTEEYKRYNVGDYIQALASSQFLPSVDGFLNRDELKQYSEGDCMAIMNAWYMDSPQNWPPSKVIHPLFISVHFNALAIEQMTDEIGIEYLKQNAPIGCRDLFTCESLIGKGIDAYFSGCMTLTLGKNYSNSQKEKKVYFVEPQIGTLWNITEFIKVISYAIINLPFVSHVFQKFIDKHTGVAKFLRVTKFCREYSRIFTKETLLMADYLSHDFSTPQDLLKSHEERLNDAETLVKKYAKASLVVTSRIHCALPCLGLGTPVIFTDNAISEKTSNCRYGGLKELFNILSWNGHYLSPLFDFQGKISIDNNIPENKPDWKNISIALQEKINSWIDHNIHS